MAKPYDATSKYLIEGYPADWLALVGLGADWPVELIDANLATVTAEADKVIRVGGPEPSLVHFELQVGRDARLPTRLFRYNALLDDRHDLPTRSVAVLFRPGADGPELTGEYRRSAPGLPDYLVFRYNVVRVWREPAAAFLAGGLGTVPLAPVADLAGQPVEEVIQGVKTRLSEAPPAQADRLRAATTILLGLRYPADQVDALVEGFFKMRESSVIQRALAEGETRGETIGAIRQARRFLIHRGERRFGPIPAADLVRVEGMSDLGRLEDLGALIITAPVTSWVEFWASVGFHDPTN